MDPFSRGPPGLTGPGPPQPSSSSYRPQSSSHFTRPRHDPPTSHPVMPSPPGPHPLTPPSLPSTPVLPGRQPLDPARKITPPEEKEMHARDEQHPASSVELESPYDTAYAYYHECKARERPLAAAAAPFERRRPLEDYEKPLAIKISVGDWVKLRRDLDLDSKNESYPRFSFDASTSTLIIQCMPSPIHQSITRVLNRQIIQSITSMPANLQQQVDVLFEQDFTSFGGQWSSSDKRPDLGIQVLNANNVMKLKWVLEVGFSESVEQLKNDVRLWLEGSSQVSMVTIVKFCETPLYRCPFPKDPIYNENGEELDMLEVLGVPSDARNILEEDVVFKREYGPATYMGLTWVGRISEVWMETWVRGVDGKAVQRGIAENLMQADQVQLDFEDLLPHGYPQTITIELGQFRSILKHCIRTMAVVRCAKAVKDHKERHGEGRDDEDFEP